MTTEDTEDTEAVNHHMNAALEAVAEVARKLKEERDEARDLAQQMSESNQVLMADVRFYRTALEQLKEAAE